MKTIRWNIAQFFEKLWWKRYLKNKDKEAYLLWKKEYWTDFLLKARIKLENDDVILDAGCGPAGVFVICDGLPVDAVDPLFEYYKDNITHFDTEDYSNVQFQNIRLEDITVKDKYSKVFCLNVINHVDDIQKVALNLCQTLMPGGELYVSIDAHNFSLLKNIFQFLPGDILHPHQYDLDDYRLLFVQHGLEVVDEVLFDKHFIFNYYLLKIKHS